MSKRRAPRLILADEDAVRRVAAIIGQPHARLRVTPMGNETHKTTDDGESTAHWVFREPGFFGSIKQLTNCGRCGRVLPSGRDRKRRVYDISKPTMHFICDECFEQLPE